MTDTPEEIAALKARLAALEGQAAAPVQTVRIAPREGMHPALKVLLWIGGIVVGGFIFMVMIGSMLPADNRTPSQRISDSCEQQFPGDSAQASDCKLRLAVQVLEKDREDRLKAAAQGAGQ